MAGENDILLRGGTLLIHDDGNHVVPTVGDLLVHGSIISKIGSNLQPGSYTRVIECKGKIISPGFIDTHRHMWQTQLRGSFSDHTLIEYMARGNAVSPLFSLEDLFYGQLAGALEAIDAGTTTVVDHSHCNSSPDHPQAAIQATISAGLRSVYCCIPLRRLISRQPLRLQDDSFSDESISIFRDLAKSGPFGDGRVHIGYALDNLFAPAKVMKSFYADLRDPSKGRAKLITSHSVGGPGFGGVPSAVQILNSLGLLGPDILLSHANFPKEGDGALLKSTGAHISSTPNTELQMGVFPVALLEDHVDNASLGVDCQTWGISDMPGQMRMLLQAARGGRGAMLAEKGTWSRHTGFDVEQVFNLATVGGANAAGLHDEVGRLKEGFKADIVVFESTSPNMVAAAIENPVAAIALHSNPSDIGMVLVDGIIRKENKQLIDVITAAAPIECKSIVKPGTRMGWGDIVFKLLESRESIKQKLVGLDFFEGEEGFIDMLYMDKNALLEQQS